MDNEQRLPMIGDSGESEYVVDPMIQRCGTCKWSKLAELEGMVYCAWPVPIWIIQLNSEYTTRDKALLYATDGKDCPTWHAK